MPITAPPTIPLITDPSTFAVRAQDWVVWQADELYPFIIETSELLSLSTASSSTTSNTIGLGAKTFIVETGKGYIAGQSLSIAYTTTPTNRMFAVVTSYNSGTGELIVNVQAIEGSGTYTVWSIALAFNGVIGTSQISNDAVTYEKIQNVTNTARILGRKTAAAGDVEECTLSEVLDFVGSIAQGDILYRDVAGWSVLAAGTSGYFLKTNGVDANPEWAIAGTNLLGTLTTTSGTTQTLSGLDLTSYKKIFAVVNGVSFTGNVFITISGNQVSAALGTTFTDALYGFIDIDLTSSIGLGLVQSGTPSISSISLGTAGRIFNSGLTAASTSITFAGGTFDAGSIKVYGVK